MRNEEVSFKVSADDFNTIDLIATRAVALGIYQPGEKMMALMDLSATHHKNPLRLEELRTADDFNFGHDVGGIRRHINRQTGELEDCFVPRFDSRPSRRRRETAATA